VLGWVQQLIPIIPVTWDKEIRRMVV
jgi:hypothetical protein